MVSEALFCSIDAFCPTHHGDYVFAHEFQPMSDEEAQFEHCCACDCFDDDVYEEEDAPA